MLTTVTLWAEPLNSRASLTASTIPGFATEKSCQAARDRLIMENAAQTGGRGVGQTGIDIKLITCVPVEYEKETQ